MQAEFHGGPIDGGFLDVPARCDGVVPVLYVMWQSRGTWPTRFQPSPNPQYGNEADPLRGHCYRRSHRGHHRIEQTNVWEYEYLGEV